MKAILLNSVIVIFVLSSCSTGKSFLHQRYTSLGHSKHHITVEKKQEYAHMNKSEKTAETPVVTVPVTAPVIAAPEKASEPLTASVNKNPAIATKKPITKLAESNFINAGVKSIKNSTGKSFTKQVKHEKRGLLFGVIDAILSIILIVLFVALVVFLIVILI